MGPDTPMVKLNPKSVPSERKFLWFLGRTDANLRSSSLAPNGFAILRVLISRRKESYPPEFSICIDLRRLNQHLLSQFIRPLRTHIFH